MGKSLKIGSFIPVNLLNNPQASCSLVNFDFLLLHNAHFNKSTILSFLVLANLGFYFLYFFYTLKSKIALF